MGIISWTARAISCFAESQWRTNNANHKLKGYLDKGLDYIDTIFAIFILSYVSSFVFLAAFWLVVKTKNARKITDYDGVMKNKTWKNDINFEQEREELHVREGHESTNIG